MNILLLHLSDIHIKSDPNVNIVLTRVEQIAAAAQRAAADASDCFLVFTGDVAFSGKDDQYELAEAFIEGLRKFLTEGNANLKVHAVIIPGNHDCDFTQEDGMRGFILNNGSLLANVTGINEAVVHQMTAIQESFFLFLSRVENKLSKDGIAQLNNGLERLQYERRFTVDNNHISFQCFNAAWMSQLNESQGHLIFPVHLIKDNEEENDLVISLFHHPDRWLESNNSRSFREYVERTSNIIMTGHEHHSDRYTKHTKIGAINEYIEGAVLQDSDKPNVSGFNVIEIDLNAQKKRITNYQWDKGIYKRQDHEGWKSFERNLHTRAKGFVNNSLFAKALQETGTPFSHRSQHTLTLPDLFIYPDLDALPIDKKRGEITDLDIPSDRVVSFIMDHPLLVITGGDQSGKTSMAKMLYQDMHDRGLVPIILNGEDIRNIDNDSLLKLADREVGKQYDTSLTERYAQLAPQHKLLIIDDFDHTTIKSRQGHNSIINAIRKHYKRIVIFAGDIFQLSEVAQGSDDESAFNAFTHVEIKEFGLQLRNRLITKWVMFDRDFTVEDIEIEHQVQEYANNVSTLLLRKTVPSYPVIILSMLQMFDLNHEIAADKGEFGYFYEAYIIQKMAKSKTPSIPMSTIDGYTTELAYKLFMAKTRTISVTQLAAFTEEYRKTYSMNVPQDTMMGVLERGEILKRDGDGSYRFKHKFIYYYFVAKHIKSNIYRESEKARLRGQVSDMAQRIYVEDFYFILMFLVYLTNDEEVIEQLLGNGKAFYADLDPCDLDKHVQHINNLDVTLPPLMLNSGDTRKHRDEYEQARDQAESLRIRSNSDEIGDLEEERDLDEIMRLNVAFRTLQIMGQVLRNFPGVLKGDIKRRLAQESYLLGLRILKFMLVVIEQDTEYFREVAVELVKEFSDVRDMEQLEKKSNQLLFLLQAGLGHSVIKKISQAVGSKHLKETYREVLTANNQISTQLIDTAIKLDHFIDFPKKEVEGLYEKVDRNRFALFILRHMVRDRLYLFSENRKLRQSICDLLGIPINDPKIIEGKNKR